ncbi:MAG TPA: amidohydrolase family protein [Candidatus Sulfotelmatobacter sp.]|nr:amidohydrolase family protein [Candidatus Sulfotelmatobacter sp.]
MIIDLHAHYVPEAFLEAIEKEGGPHGATIRQDPEGPTMMVGGRPYGPITPHYYDAQPRLKEMDKMGVDLQVLSLNPPMVYWAPPDLGAHLARVYNDTLAASVAEAPDRLAGLATVPLQDAPAAAAELTRAIRELKLKGVYIGSNVNGKDLDHPDLFPFFQAAEALRAPVFIHPVDVLGVERLRAYYLHNGLGNPYETALAAARLIFGGVLDRLPRLQVCLAHAGGALPGLIGRLDRVYKMRREAKVNSLRRAPSTYLRRFTFDTITHHEPALKYLIGLVGADRVALGTDYRFDMGTMDPVGAVQRLRPLSKADRTAILSGTATKLLKV